MEPYVNTVTKLKIKHNKCGNTYEVTPSAFLSGTRCPYCSISAKKTNQQFQEEVHDLVGSEYEFLESYINNKTKIKVKHNKCGHIYKVTPHHFLRGVRCPKCYGTPKKTDVQFKKEVYDLVGDEYTFLDYYIDANTKLRVKHNRCGNTYSVLPSSFLRGHRCPYCYGNLKKNNADFKRYIYNLVGAEYKFLDTYVDSKTKIRVKHIKCGNIYEVTPNNFFTGYRCPYCSSPKGEVAVNKILKSLRIKYEPQKTFDDLRDNRLLSYDFFVPSQSILIEYQGLQHYEPIDIFGGVSQFKLQQKHDKMKSDYAKAHNYNLIAVPYTEDTFSKIKKYLLKHGLTA